MKRNLPEQEDLTQQTLFAIPDAPVRPFSPLQILTASESNEWYTPPGILARAREVVGEIDLDPASCRVANQIVQARTYYDKQHNGLRLPWHGRVWLNPPYGSRVAAWIAKALHEYETAQRVSQMLVLVKAATDTTWFRRLYAYPICFLHGRVGFVRSFDSDAISIAPFPSAVIYLGAQQDRFYTAFSALGTVMYRMDGSVRAETADCGTLA